MPTSSQQGPFMATCLTMLWGHFMALCLVVLGRLIPSSNEDSIDIPQCAVIRPGLVSSQSFWTIAVLLASWDRKIVLLVASSHIESIITVLQSLTSYGNAYQHFITGSVTHLLI